MCWRRVAPCAELAEERRSDPPAFGSKLFLRRLGIAGADPQVIEWTADLLHRGLTLYGTFAREPLKQFRDRVRMWLEELTEDRARTVRRLESEATAVARLLDGGTARRQSAKLLPGDGRDERIAKYERHLHTMLTSTLHELERLQARRDGERISPPAVADVNIALDTRSC